VNGPVPQALRAASPEDETALSPEQRLCAAILEQAWLDLIGPICGPRTMERQLHRLDAYEWLMSDSRDVCSARSCATAIHFPLSRLREQVLSQCRQAIPFMVAYGKRRCIAKAKPGVRCMKPGRPQPWGGRHAYLCVRHRGWDGPHDRA